LDTVPGKMGVLHIARAWAVGAVLATVFSAANADAGHLSMGPTVVTTAPYRIEAIQPPVGVLTAAIGQPLLVQPLIPLGTVVLDGDVSTGLFIRPLRLSAGTPLFLARFAGGDAYCGVAVAGLFSICLMDTTGSGRFETIGVSRSVPRSPGAPSGFNGMPLIYFPPTEFKPLNATIPYHLSGPPPIPPTTVELRWAPWHGPAKTTIGVGLVFRSGKQTEAPHSDATLGLKATGSTVFGYAGATIEIISLSNRILTYRVLGAMPTHDDKLTATFDQSGLHWTR
jgi:hypothetical protein